MPLSGLGREDISRSCSCSFVCVCVCGGGLCVFKWIHLKHKTPANIKSCVCCNREGRRDEQGRRASSADGTTCKQRLLPTATGLFVLMICSRLCLYNMQSFSARGLLACITAFICSNLLAYLTETAEQNYFHSVIRQATPALHLHSD